MKLIALLSSIFFILGVAQSSFAFSNVNNRFDSPSYKYKGYKRPRNKVRRVCGNSMQTRSGIRNCIELSRNFGFRPGVVRSCANSTRRDRAALRCIETALYLGLNPQRIRRCRQKSLNRPRPMNAFFRCLDRNNRW